MVSENLSLFFNPDEFAVNAQWHQKKVSGLLDQRYVEIHQIASFHPVFTCAASDVIGIAQGDTFIMDETHYHIAAIQPDGTGFVTLVLEIATCNSISKPMCQK
jgi:hypothetical protein